MKWVKTELNLENHIFVSALEVEDLESGDKLVDDYLSNLSKTSIDPSKPMWDFHLLNIKTSHAEATGFLRAHHSIGDGMSLMSLLVDGSHKTTDARALPTRAVFSDYSRKFKNFVEKIWNSVAGMMMITITALFLKDTNTPIKGPSGVEFKPRRFVFRTVNLDDFKLVKNFMKATVNDVALGVIQAGLSTYLNRRYGEDKKEVDGVGNTNQNLPKNIRLRAAIFMNLRGSSGISVLSDMMMKGSQVRWGNNIGCVLVPLTIAFRSNPLDYVIEAKEAMIKKKNSIEASFTYFITKYIPKFLGIKVLRFLSTRIFTHTTLVFSNVPGPREEIAFGGYPISILAFSCYGQPSALLIHAVSYQNKIMFALSVDEETIPDPQQLFDDLEDWLKIIKGCCT